jgi:hypothetical protein
VTFTHTSTHNEPWRCKYQRCNFRTLLYRLHLSTLHAADHISLLYQLSVLTRKLEPTFGFSVVCNHAVRPSGGHTNTATAPCKNRVVSNKDCYKRHSWEADSGSSNRGIPCPLCDRQVHWQVVACSSRSATRATAEPLRINTCILIHSDVMSLWRKIGRKLMCWKVQQFLISKETKNRTANLKAPVHDGRYRPSLRSKDVIRPSLSSPPIQTLCIIPIVEAHNMHHDWVPI